MLKRFRVLLFLSFFLVKGNKNIIAQIPQLLNGGFVFLNNPCWLSCNGGDFSLFLEPDKAIGNHIMFFWDNSIYDYNNNGCQTLGFIWFFKDAELIELNYYNIFIHKWVFILLC